MGKKSMSRLQAKKLAVKKAKLTTKGTERKRAAATDDKSATVGDDRALRKAAAVFLTGLRSSGGVDDGDGDNDKTAPVEKVTGKAGKRERGEASAVENGKNARLTPSTDEAVTNTTRAGKQTKTKKAKKEDFFVPLEEGGDEVDEAVSRQVLARTTRFLSGLSSEKKQSFWSTRDVATGSGAVASRGAPVVEKTASRQKPKKGGRRVPVGFDEADDSLDDGDMQGDDEEEEEEDGGSSVTSSEPSWISESDDEEYFARMEGKTATGSKQGGGGKSVPKEVGSSNDGSDDGDDDEDDGVWSDDD